MEFVYIICVFQSENVRWAHSVAQYREQEETLSGDVLLTAAFISYAGSFSKKYRRELLENLWMPFLRSQKVSVSQILTKTDPWLVLSRPPSLTMLIASCMPFVRS